LVDALVLLSALTCSCTAPTARHVRSTEPRVATLIAKGLSLSGTLRRLVQSLDESDVIVYVETSVVPQRFKGYLLHHVTNRGHCRYLRVVVSAEGRDEHLIGVLAHELQHAREVAQAPEARDEKSLAALFSRIGLCPGCVGPVYETDAAISLEAAVKKELTTHGVTVRPR
jgi:hypothetical protein